MGMEEITEEVIENVAQTFKALADPTRVKILFLLSQQQCSVNQIVESLQLSQSAVSHQLATLRSLRLVKYRREGNSLYYTYDDEHVINILKQTISHNLHE